MANTVGGLSGPAIKPIALRMVWQVAQAVKIPVIGIGRLSPTEHPLEFLLAGATAIEVGTANFVNPRASQEIVEGLGRYVTDNGLAGISEVIGGLILD